MGRKLGPLVVDSVPIGPEGLIQEASKYESVLDVGCGFGSCINAVHAPRCLGIDMCEPALRQARKGRLQPGRVRAEFLQMDVRSLATRFARDEFECITCMDLLEHLEKPESFQLLDAFDTVASQCVMIFCPIGLHTQTGDPWEVGNEEYNTYRSTWAVSDFTQRSYDVVFVPDWFREKRPSPESLAAIWAVKTSCTTGAVRELCKDECLNWKEPQ